MRKFLFLLLFALFAFTQQSNAANSSEESKDQTAATVTSKTNVTIYPILIQAPIFGADLDLPSLPNGGGGGGTGGGEVSGSTNSKLNGAALLGFSIDNPKWFLDFAGMWAGLTAERDTPVLVKVRTNTYALHLTGGWHVYHDFSVTGGFRYMGLKIHAQLGDVLDQTVKPGVWDPMVGVDWRRPIGDKWNVVANVQGGGFGVGSDVDVSSEVHADWRFARHFSLDFGYNFLYYKITLANVTVGPFDRKLVTKQTLIGPRFGFGICF